MQFQVIKKLPESDIELRVTFNDVSEFDSAIDSLHQLIMKHKLKALEKPMQILWHTSNDVRKVVASVEDTIHRIVICLFANQLEGLRTSAISQSVDLADSTVSNILNGNTGESGHLFEKKGSLWFLSTIGLSESIESIFPFYLREDE